MLAQVKYFSYLCRRKQNKDNFMALPIAETPILFGEDARRFEERMRQSRRETPEARARRIADYELLKSMFVNF